jgi:hypothetical protein
MASVNVYWSEPLTYPDGSPFTNLAGFDVLLGFSTGNYSIVRDVGLVFHKVITGLNEGTPYFIAVRARDNLGNVSALSAEVTATAHPYWTSSKQVMG